MTTKIHALVDAEGRPVAPKLTEGQAHDGKAADDLLGNRGGGQILLGDRAYDSDKRQNGATLGSGPLEGLLGVKILQELCAALP